MPHACTRACLLRSGVFVSRAAQHPEDRETPLREERGLTAAAGAWSGKETTGTRCESPEPLCVWCGREWFVRWDTQLTRGRWWWHYASPANNHLTPCHATWKGRSVSSAARCREERHACKAGIIAAHSKGRSERWSVRREATSATERRRTHVLTPGWLKPNDTGSLRGK